MAFDQSTRNRLARFVSDARRLIAEEFTYQFRSLYGIAESGQLTPPENLGHLNEVQKATAARLRERIGYLVRSHPGEKQPEATAVHRLAREQAFTILNRLAAVRMAEKRGLIVESVGKGYQSKGFKVYETVAGSGLGDAYHRYRRYLFCLFDELAVDLGVLFDRRSPSGLLFPRENALLDLLALLNAPDLDALWAEDETIGWIYQYYNDPAERKKMRDESSAPRNSRELAVRNQFFTPRYVVEFLTDNTLGRIWYEMTKGKTRLKEQCRYLVRRPHEFFLHESTRYFKNVRPGFFDQGLSQLPDEPTWDEIQAVALCLEGYPHTLMTELGLGECVAFGERKKAEFKASGKYEGSILELLCCLFCEQRNWHWAGWGDDPAPEDLERARTIYRALRAALAEPPTGSQEDILRQPVFVPHRPLKDPRTILMLDPACGSMHFGLYAFDLFEVIYEEAWNHPDIGSKLQADYGVKSPVAPRLDAGSVALRTDAPLHCAISGRTMTPDEAVIALKPYDQGSKQRRGRPILCHRDEAQRRQGQLRHTFPLVGFSFSTAIAEDWFEDADARAFLAETGCFAYALIEEPPSPTKDEAFARFQRDVPRLMIEHNLHGIDIDPRCAQIAGLSLWLRAQKAWQRLGLKPAERPAIKRSNIVCAEPMPGEKELLREFVEREFPAAERPVCLRLLEAIFDKMQLAGEAGSLLKIEEEIRSAIEDARDAWQKLATKPPELFTTTELNQLSTAPELTGLEQAVSSLTTAPRHLTTDFWERIEERIYAALRDYAEQAENGGGFQRRLFAEDAARGFAFIDVCRKRYDVALMNPPFGEVPATVADYNSGRYPHWIDNILCAFIARGWQMTESQGTVGVIFDRTAIVKSSYEDFRRHVLLATNRISALADTGWEVLDANVETTCLTLARLPEEQTSLFFDVRRMPPDEKGSSLNGFLENSQAATLSEGITLAWPLSFNRLPNAVLGYDFPEFLKLAFSAFDGLGDSGFTAYQGHALEAEVHYRAWWELPHPTPQTPLSDWTFAFKGGDYSPFYLVPSDVAFYGKRGSRVPDSTANVLRNLNFQQLPGVAFGKRGEFLDAQPLPRGSIFTHEGHAIPNLSAHDSWFVLAVLNTAFFSVAVNTFCGQHKTSGYVNLFPLARFDAVQRAQLAKLAKAIHDKKAGWYRGEERNPHFAVVYSADNSRGHSSFAELIRSSLSAVKTSDGFVKDTENTIEETIRAAYQLTDSEQEWVQRGCESRPQDATWYDRKEISSANAIIELATSHVSYWLGCTFGRWDIRYATGEQAAPELPDPFAPLPVCPPGQLQNAQGLPARPEDVPAEYPVRIPWDGILVDDPNHPLDIERRVREVIEIIWSGHEGGPTAEAIEHEACEILGVKTLRDYFRKPAGFFADHLKRYSKSRRQAPIYWPLSTASGSYTLWIYYHRLTDQTLHTAIADFLDPKIKALDQEIVALRERSDGAAGGKAGELLDFQDELKALRAELERVIRLPWKPNLNDGVLITASPLWKLFRLSKWQKDLKACWEELEKGEYDWAHLAYSIWPQRVEKACETDRSLAIAHGLEHLCKVEPPKTKAPRRAKPDAAAVERAAKKDALLEELTEAFANVFLGEKIPLDVTNAKTGEIIIPANRKITKTLLRKLAGVFDHLHIAPSPIRKAILAIIATFEPRFAALDETGSVSGTDQTLLSLEPANSAPLESTTETSEHDGESSSGSVHRSEVSNDRPAPIDQTDRTEILCTIRQVFNDGQVRDRDTAFRDIAAALGYQRVGSRIREILNNDLLTAVRRGILENQGGQLKLLVGDVRQYERDFQKENFLSALGRTWTERDDAIRAFARWLGYARTGPVIDETARSLIRGLLKENRLEADGNRIRRVS